MENENVRFCVNQIFKQINKITNESTQGVRKCAEEPDHLDECLREIVRENFIRCNAIYNQISNECTKTNK